jgi:hypothetical protein
MAFWRDTATRGPGHEPGSSRAAPGGAAGTPAAGLCVETPARHGHAALVIAADRSGSFQTWLVLREAIRPTYEPEFPGESKGLGDGDLMGRVGPATLSPEEVVRRLVSLEFESFEEN